MSFWKGVRIVIFGTMVLSPVVTLAQSLPGLSTIVPTNCQGADAASKCGVCDLATLAQNILNTSIYILIILSAILFAWTGWKMLTSGGNSSEYQAGKRMFGSVFTGLIIIMGAWIAVDTLMKVMFNSDKYGPWNKICEIAQDIEGIFEHHYA